jgi:hypothetical protein
MKQLKEDIKTDEINKELRMPEKVSDDDIIKKYKRYDKLEFSKKEVEFFNKFIESNELVSKLDNTHKDGQGNYAYTVPNFRINTKNKMA